MSETPLAGRTALQTRGARGIGLATARVIAAAGAQVFCLARASVALDEAVADVGSGAQAIPCDLTVPSEITKALDTIRAACGGAPDVIVQAAGTFPLAPFQKTPPTEFDFALEVNLIGPFRLAQPLTADMRSRGSGHLVTVGSVADRTIFPENIAYAASKFGTRAVHEVLREELRGSGVRVSLVSPGPVDTAIWDAIDPDTRPGFTPRARMLRPEAVADAVLFVLTRPVDVNIDELRLGRS